MIRQVQKEKRGKKRKKEHKKELQGRSLYSRRCHFRWEPHNGLTTTMKRNENGSKRKNNVF